MSAVATHATEQQAYLAQCARLRVHPNSALQRSLFVSGGAVQALDLSGNLIGPRGLAALLPALTHFASSLHTLILAHNTLDNASAILLSRRLASGFPALRVVDVSGNPFTFQAAKHLAWMCEGVSLPYAATNPPSTGLPETATDLSPMQLRARGLSTTGWDNNIEQVVLETMPLLTATQCECVLQRIDAAIQRRQERKRALKAFHRQARRRSTATGAALSDAAAPCAAGDKATPGQAVGVEEEFPDDVARTPSGRVVGAEAGVSPVGFLEHEAAGQLQVDIGVPRAPAIPQILLQRKAKTPTSPQRPRGAAQVPVGKADSDDDGAPTESGLQAPARTDAAKEVSELGLSPRSRLLSPRRPPMPRPSPRSVRSSQALLSFLEQDDAGALTDAEAPPVSASVEKCSLTCDQECHGTQRGSTVAESEVNLEGFEEEELVDEDEVKHQTRGSQLHDSTAGLVAEGDEEDGVDHAEGRYADESYGAATYGDDYGVAAADDWLFTGALEPLDFTPPGSSKHAPGSTLPPTTSAETEVPLPPSLQLSAPPALGDAVPEFLDDLAFDLGAMDTEVGAEKGTATTVPPAGGAAVSQTVTRADRVLEEPAKPPTSGDDGVPSWLEF